VSPAALAMTPKIREMIVIGRRMMVEKIACSL
jgi:hypothetical protein